jgi:hypothetical protein
MPEQLRVALVCTVIESDLRNGFGAEFTVELSMMATCSVNIFVQNCETID